MYAFIQQSSEGIPLFVFDAQSYSPWYDNQDSFTQQWIEELGHKPDPKGKTSSAVFNLPHTDGSLKSAVVIVDSLDDPWIAGSLPKKLLKKTYLLQTDVLLGDQGNEKDTEDKNQQRLYRFALSWGLGCYQFDRYREKSQTYPLLSIEDEQTVQKAHQWIKAIYKVRNLINTPADAMMPQDISQTVQEMANEFDAEFSEVVGDQLLEQNFPCIHAVGRASTHAPRLIELKWGNPEHPKLALVGKGVSFDSGGLDLKPASGMRLMKKDMGGAAHAIGLAQAIMAFQLPVQLHLLVPAVENAVSDNAFRPGDVLSSRKGLNIEIDNTDAEGRLILSDALALAEEAEPDWIIDFATLTGACRVALGTELPGFFCNHKDAAREMFSAGDETGDPVWQLPLHKPYDSMIKSQIADLVNSAASPFGGAITAALFLQHFVSDKRKWFHFDVMAWNQRELPGRPAGGEAMGVLAVFKWLETQLVNESS